MTKHEPADQVATRPSLPEVGCWRPRQRRVLGDRRIPLPVARPSRSTASKPSLLDPTLSVRAPIAAPMRPSPLQPQSQIYSRPARPLAMPSCNRRRGGAFFPDRRMRTCVAAGPVMTFVAEERRAKVHDFATRANRYTAAQRALTPSRTNVMQPNAKSSCGSPASPLRLTRSPGVTCLNTALEPFQTQALRHYTNGGETDRRSGAETFFCARSKRDFSWPATTNDCGQFEPLHRRHPLTAINRLGPYDNGLTGSTSKYQPY